MKRRALDDALVALLYLAPCLGAAGTARATPAACQMALLAEMPVTMIDGQPTIEARINDQPVRMLVDTGSVETFITRRGAHDLHLTLRPHTGIEFYGVGGKTQAETTTVKSFGVGGATAASWEMIVLGEGDVGPVQGVLGSMFLTQADVEFDLPEGKIRFFKPRNCDGDQVIYWGQAYSVTPLLSYPDSSIRVNVRLNGALVTAQLDSGAVTSVLTLQGAARGGLSPQSSGVVAVGRSSGIGSQHVADYLGVFSTFAFGDETIHNAKLRFADLFNADKETDTDTRIAHDVVDNPEMLLGADFFASHRIYVARGQHKVYVSYAGGPVFQVRKSTESTVAPASGAQDSAPKESH